MTVTTKKDLANNVNEKLFCLNSNVLTKYFSDKPQYRLFNRSYQLQVNADICTQALYKRFFCDTESRFCLISTIRFESTSLIPVGFAITQWVLSIYWYQGFIPQCEMYTQLVKQRPSTRNKSHRRFADYALISKRLYKLGYYDGGSCFLSLEFQKIVG